MVKNGQSVHVVSFGFPNFGSALKFGPGATVPASIKFSDASVSAPATTGFVSVAYPGSPPVALVLGIAYLPPE